MNKRNKLIKIVVTFSCLLCLTVGAVLFAVFLDNDSSKQHKYVLSQFENQTQVVVKQNIQTIQTVERNIPTEVENEGISEKYPTYGTIMDFSEEEREKLFEENKILFESFDSMDAQGNLYLSGTATGKKLYKHTASVGNYLGDVSDQEKAVVQSITVCSDERRNFITGLYAPAGEIVKIEISAEDLEQIGSLNVVVGRVTNQNNIHSIPESKTSFARMPIIAKSFSINSTVAYVGNFLGGPIYISPSVYGKQFTVKISGAVQYPYFIYGKTTREQFEQMKNLSAPYFDFEVWDLGVRHSGPAMYGNYDFDNLMQVGALWENVTCASRQVPNTSNKYVSVGFLYDPYVAAGSACAYQGGSPWVNAPYNCLGLALDYQSMVTNGFWGLLHELNHHYQNYGLAPYGEVSNNATSLISYILYTDISSARSENDGSLSGWNIYTDPTRSLRETISKAANGEVQTSLNIYADILHNFGTDKFVKATQLSAGKHDVDSWYLALTQATGYDMTYYFETLLNQTVSDQAKAQVQSDLPVFVPVACLYQVGRYVQENQQKAYVQTVRPYKINSGSSYTLNFEDYLIVPDGFEYQIKNITNPQNGTITKISDKKYLYTPCQDLDSGNFEITISLTHPNISVQDITLVLSLEQKQASVVATKYVYDSRIYSTADQAVENNFEGYVSKTEQSTTSTFLNGIANKQIGVVEGKIYIPENGDYVFCLRAGRGDNALYISLDGENFDKVLNFSEMKNTFDLDQSHTCSYTLKKGQYVYFKQVVVAAVYQSDAFTEIGWTTSNTTPETIPAKYLLNKNGEYKIFDFTCENKYPRENKVTLTTYQSNPANWEILSCNMSSWDQSTSIQNILDGNKNTFYHNDKNNFVSSENTFELFVDTHTTQFVNTLAIFTRNSGQENIPCTFDLYAGLEKENLTLVGQYSDLALSNRQVTAKFLGQNIRYFKIVVKDTKSNLSGDYNHYVTISQIDLLYTFDGDVICPDGLKIYTNAYTSFEKDFDTTATFGHLISGNGKLKFDFEGSQFALFTCQKQQCVLKIEIDGIVMQVTIDEQQKTTPDFVSEIYEQKSHNITITVVEGILNLDSIAVG